MENSKTYINPRPVTGELNVLFAGESTTHPSHSVGPLIHDYYLIHYILSGIGTFRCHGKKHVLGAGDSFFIFPGEIVSYEADDEEPWRYRWIALEDERSADSLMERLHITPEHPTAHPLYGKQTASAYWRMMQCLRKGDDACDLQAPAYARLLFAGYVVSMDDETDRPSTDSSVARTQVEQAIRYMSLQYYQPISIEQMAHDMGYHRTHFNKIFKEVTGLAPFRYLTKIRMKQAARLLKEALTVQQVAASVGYNDALYFSKQFKSFYGMPPSAYQQERRPLGIRNPV